MSNMLIENTKEYLEETLDLFSHGGVQFTEKLKETLVQTVCFKQLNINTDLLTIENTNSILKYNIKPFVGFSKIIDVNKSTNNITVTDNFELKCRNGYIFFLEKIEDYSVSKQKIETVLYTGYKKENSLGEIEYFNINLNIDKKSTLNEIDLLRYDIGKLIEKIDLLIDLTINLKTRLGSKCFKNDLCYYFIYWYSNDLLIQEKYIRGKVSYKKYYKYRSNFKLKSIKQIKYRRDKKVYIKLWFYNKHGKLIKKKKVTRNKIKIKNFN